MSHFSHQPPSRCKDIHRHKGVQEHDNRRAVHDTFHHGGSSGRNAQRYSDVVKEGTYNRTTFLVTAYR